MLGMDGEKCASAIKIKEKAPLSISYLPEDGDKYALKHFKDLCNELLMLE